jgi:leader peptidase (prepilin peptidase)/N-methyltransferase
VTEILVGASQHLAPTTTNDRARPDLLVLLGGGLAGAVVSAVSLPMPVAIASTVLGALMIAGAEVDARTFLLPDTVTWGAVVSGVVAAAAPSPLDPWPSTGAAVVGPYRCALRLQPAPP